MNLPNQVDTNGLATLNQVPDMEEVRIVTRRMPNPNAVGHGGERDHISVTLPRLRCLSDMELDCVQPEHIPPEVDTIPGRGAY